MAAIACILLLLAATAGARPAYDVVPQKSASPGAEAPTAVQEPVVGPDNGTDAPVFVLIGVAAGVAVLGAGYMGARRATRTARAQPTNVRIS